MSIQVPGALAPLETLEIPPPDVVGTSVEGVHALLVAQMRAAGPEATAQAEAEAIILGILDTLQQMVGVNEVSAEQAKSYTHFNMLFGDRIQILENAWKNPSPEQTDKLGAWKQQYATFRQLLKSKSVNIDGDVHMQRIL